MRKFLAVFLIVMMGFQLSGCSVFMAARQPDKKDLGMLSSGISRDNVIAEFGMPIGSEVINGDKAEIYKFNEGYSKGLKISRAAFHGLMDIGTLFIWELVAMPIEMVANGKEMKVKVTYDTDNRVKDISYLQA